MVIKNIYCYVLLLGGLLPLTTISHAANDQMTNISCSDSSGNVVYKDKISISTTYEESKRIADSYPNSLCVFLRDHDNQDNLTDVIGNNYLSNDNSLLPDLNHDQSFINALAVLTEGRVGQAYPHDIDRTFNAIKGNGDSLSSNNKKTSTEEKSGGYINVTIGLYKGVSMSDILNHWGKMKTGGNILKNLAPVFEEVEDVTVMSVMNIPDSQIQQVCDELSATGQGCISFF